jgi:hypothetical protein
MSIYWLLYEEISHSMSQPSMLLHWSSRLLHSLDSRLPSDQTVPMMVFDCWHSLWYCNCVIRPASNSWRHNSHSWSSILCHLISFSLVMCSIVSLSVFLFTMHSQWLNKLEYQLFSLLGMKECVFYALLLGDITDHHLSLHNNLAEGKVEGVLWLLGVRTASVIRRVGDGTCGLMDGATGVGGWDSMARRTGSLYNWNCRPMSVDSHTKVHNLITIGTHTCCDCNQVEVWICCK